MALSNDFIVKSGLVVKSTTTVVSLDSLVTSNVVRAPSKPALDLNFTRSTTLDPRISFARASNATSIDIDGTIKTVGINKPRYDYNNQSRQNFGLLLEPAKTNLLAGGGRPIPANQVAAGNILSTSTDVPYLEAGSVISKHVRYPSSTGDNNMGYHGTTIPGNTAHALSTYVWIPSATTVTSVGLTSDGVSFTQFNADLTKRDQWQRVYTTATTTATQFIISVLRPNGMTDGGIIYSTCWQIEAGTYPTSYIPTFTASATRSADAVSIAGQNFNSWYTQGQGTVFLETYLYGPRTGVSGFMAALYQSATAYIGMQYVDAAGRFTGTNYCVANGITHITTNVDGGNNNFNQINKQAIAFDPTSFTAFFNGKEYSTSTTFGGIPVVSQLSLGGRAGSGSDFPGHGSIRRVTYYPQKLSTAQLQVLTARD
jgi:hypothetical protein